jgi:hypothetical protein
MGTLLLVSAGFMIYHFDLKKYFLRFFGPIGAVIIFLTIFTIDLRQTAIYCRKIEPEIEYKMMARRVLPLSAMATAEDSVKREAALMGMWFDMKEMSPEYMRSIILSGSDYSLKHQIEVFSHLTTFYTFYTFYVLGFFCLLLLSIYLSTKKLSDIVKHSQLFIFTFLVLYAIDYNSLLLDNRHFLSLVLVALLIHCFYFFDSLGDAPKSKLVGGLSSICLFFSLAHTLYNYKHENELAENSLNEMEQIMKGFEEKYTGKMVAITIDNRFLFDQHFYLDNRIYTKKHLYHV